MAASPLLEGLSAHDADRVWSAARERWLEKGEVLFRQDEPADAFTSSTRAG